MLLVVLLPSKQTHPQTNSMRYQSYQFIFFTTVQLLCPLYVKGAGRIFPPDWLVTRARFSRTVWSPATRTIANIRALARYINLCTQGLPH